MKKTIIIFALLIASVGIYAQKEASDQKSATQDSITAQDVVKIRYVVSVIVSEYNQECYRDSVPITEFHDKPVGGVWWQQKGRYYWDVLEPLPNNVKYLHRRMTTEGLLERFATRLGGQ